MQIYGGERIACCGARRRLKARAELVNNTCSQAMRADYYTRRLLFFCARIYIHTVLCLFWWIQGWDGEGVFCAVLRFLLGATCDENKRVHARGINQCRTGGQVNLFWPKRRALCWIIHGKKSIVNICPLFDCAHHKFPIWMEADLLLVGKQTLSICCFIIWQACNIAGKCCFSVYGWIDFGTQETLLLSSNFSQVCANCIHFSRRTARSVGTDVYFPFSRANSQNMYVVLLQHILLTVKKLCDFICAIPHRTGGGVMLPATRELCIRMELSDAERNRNCVRKFAIDRWSISIIQARWLDSLNCEAAMRCWNFDAVQPQSFQALDPLFCPAEGCFGVIFTSLMHKKGLSQVMPVGEGAFVWPKVCSARKKCKLCNQQKAGERDIFHKERF